jgi:hypothetical protein
MNVPRCGLLRYAFPILGEALALESIGKSICKSSTCPFVCGLFEQDTDHPETKATPGSHFGMSEQASKDAIRAKVRAFSVRLDFNRGARLPLAPG